MLLKILEKLDRRCVRKKLPTYDKFAQTIDPGSDRTYALARQTLEQIRKGKVDMPKADPPIDIGVAELTPELKKKEIEEGSRVTDDKRRLPEPGNRYMTR